ncbi:MAG TPA: hypothetical protein VFQ67_01590 [Allosphingosinicella sp.]|jgi:hypothetical protein|nr:hypothetical protein [Allosphingosinicella sp.]
METPTIPPLIEQLVAEAAAATARKYPIALDSAADILRARFEADDALLKAGERASSLKQLQKMRACRDAVDAAQRAIYFDLRRYRRNEEEMAEAIEAIERAPPGEDPGSVAAAIDRIRASHVSTAERSDRAGELSGLLAQVLEGAVTVADIGSGVFPLLFPFDRLPRLRTLLALDRDPAAVRALQAYSRWRGDGRLSSHLWEAADGWQRLLETFPDGVEAALMLKLVPVVGRQTPELVETLARVPARRLVVTGSRQAMAKRASIEDRERRTIERFAAQGRWTIADRFQTEDEVGLVLERGG